MDKEDWEAIIKIIKHLEDGMLKVKQNLYPVLDIESATKIAEERIRQLSCNEKE